MKFQRIIYRQVNPKCCYKIGRGSTVKYGVLTIDKCRIKNLLSLSTQSECLPFMHSSNRTQYLPTYPDHMYVTRTFKQEMEIQIFIEKLH